jgi:hypothetical protein
MTNPNINNAIDSPNDDREIARRGQIFYESAIRSKVETPDNIGKIISIDIETGNYEIDDNLPKGGRKAPRFSGGDERCCGFSRLETIIGL